MPTIFMPSIIERSSRGERTYDIYSRLLMDRIVFLGTEIDDDVANVIIAQLLFLEADNPGKEISVYLNCPGGSVSAGLAMYDTMKHISVAGQHDLHGLRGEHGLLHARGRRHQGKAVRASARAHHDAPAVGRSAGRRGGH